MERLVSNLTFLKDHPVEIVCGVFATIVVFNLIKRKMLKIWIIENLFILNIAMEQSKVNLKKRFSRIIIEVKHPHPKANEFEINKNRINSFAPDGYKVEDTKRSSKKFQIILRQIRNCRPYDMPLSKLKVGELYCGHNEFGEKVSSPIQSIYMAGMTGMGKTQMMENLIRQIKGKSPEYKIYYASPKKDALINCCDKYFHITEATQLNALKTLMLKTIAKAEEFPESPQKVVFVVDEIGYCLEEFKANKDKEAMDLFRVLAQVLRIGRSSQVFAFLASQQLKIQELSASTPIHRAMIPIVLTFYVKELEAYKNAFGSDEHYYSLKMPGQGRVQSNQIDSFFYAPRRIK
ncbi:MAG: hypothetical protein H6626_05735 [Pseudobdellovibrionaceae bacterium]|nr:hypothetical protein [Bdellovibrionales bacterium]USN48595.1 MAG: hypothetical protein H6626_05735 [Pseudobdellovibrionaceae bacterium]